MRDGKSVLSDAEYVERVRRGIARSDRLRWALLALHLGLVVAFVGLAIAASDLVRARAGAWPGLGVGFGVGLALGASLGMLAVTIAHGLVNALTRGGRAERLLVRYYDAAREFWAERAVGEETAGPGAAADRRPTR